MAVDSTEARSRFPSRVEPPARECGRHVSPTNGRRPATTTSVCSAFSRRPLHAHHCSSIDSVKGPSDWFTGNVYIDADDSAPSSSRVTAILVHLMPGARTHWRRHPLSQTVFVTEGIGLCQRRGGPIEVIRPAIASCSRLTRSIGMAPPRTGAWSTWPPTKATRTTTSSLAHPVTDEEYSQHPMSPDTEER